MTIGYLMYKTQPVVKNTILLDRISLQPANIKMSYITDMRNILDECMSVWKRNFLELYDDYDYESYLIKRGHIERPKCSCMSSWTVASSARCCCGFTTYIETAAYMNNEYRLVRSEHSQ